MCVGREVKTGAGKQRTMDSRVSHPVQRVTRAGRAPFGGTGAGAASRRSVHGHARVQGFACPEKKNARR